MSVVKIQNCIFDLFKLCLQISASRVSAEFTHKSKSLDGHEGCHGDHGNHAEGIRQNIASCRHTGSHGDGQHHKDPHTCRNRQDDDHVRDGGYLFCQYLKVRFCHGDNDAKDKADKDGPDDFLGLAHLDAHALAHGGHGQICAQSEDAHTEDQKEGTE